jgi:hypothetical protein
MKTLDEQRYSTRLIAEASETETPRCSLSINGSDLEASMEGAIFETVIEFEDHYLVFTTNDCPYEETLNIYFLDPSLKTLDEASLSWPYATGSFEIVDTIQPNRVRFKFFEQEVWEVTLHTSKHFAFPFFSYPSGVWRKFQFNRYFKINRLKQ